MRPACIPATSSRLADLAKFPFTTKADLRDNYPFGMFAVPREQVLPHPRVVRDDRQADRRRLHGERRRHLGRSSWRARSAPPADAPGDIVHVAYGYGLFTGGLGAHYGAEKLGCTVIPMSGGHDRAAGAADPRLQAVDHHGDAVATCWRSPRRWRSRDSTRARSSLEVGIFGAEPWTRGDARNDREAPRHGRDRHLRPVRGDRPRRRPGVHRDQGRASRSGRTISIPRSSTRRPAPCCPTASRASWCSPR